MEGSSLTNEEIEAALQLIQLISEDGSTAAAAYASSSSLPFTMEKILERKNGSFGKRKRKLFPSARARIRRRIRNKETKAAEQLLHLSEEEESGGNTSEGSNVTDESCAVAVETRADQDGESEAKRGGGSKSERRDLSSDFMEEEGEGEFMEEDLCLANFLRRRRERKFRSLIDIYINGARD